MKTYWRMIKMVKPYLGQLVLAIVCMIIFSGMSVFSASMISPFLQALFSEELAAQESTVLADMPGASGVWEEAGVVHEGAHPESAKLAEQVNSEEAADTPRQDDPARQRYEDLKAKASGLESLKYKFKDWVDDTLLKGTKQEALLRIVLWFFFLALLKNIFCYLQEVLMVYVSQVVVRDLRNQLFVKMTAMPLSFYHQHKGGELISRATNDVLIAQQCISASFSKLVKEPFLVVGFLGVALILSWKLTLIALTLMPVSMIVIIRIGKRLRHLSHKQQEQMADLTSTLQETVYGIRVVKAFAMEDFENRKFLRQSHGLFKQIFRINYVMKLSSPLTEQLMMIVGLFLLWYGGSRIFTGGAMAPDLFIVFLFMIFSMVRPLKALGTVNNDIQAGMAAADRIFSILDAEPEVTGGGHTTVLGTARGEVLFDHVNFSYLPGEPVLRDVSLEVKPGEVVALVGSSGSGKSTLIDLIPGFHHPDEGSVRVDGHDVRDLDLGDLRGNMGIVTQEVILFHDTVRNNIAYGLSDVSDEDIQAAAKAANADEFIARMPEGYDTIIGDRGLKLSGGQRQRISIARAILKNPAILLLDEATSALDTEAEHLVQEAIDRLVKDRTTIVIAHRLSTIQNVDRIYLLEEGRVMQTGTHDELLAAGGRYKELYTMQFAR
jgi:subfamily B ATP-binding cassette protein MsbA